MVLLSLPSFAGLGLSVSTLFVLEALDSIFMTLEEAWIAGKIAGWFDSKWNRERTSLGRAARFCILKLPGQWNKIMPAGTLGLVCYQIFVESQIGPIE